MKWNGIKNIVLKAAFLGSFGVQAQDGVLNAVTYDRYLKVPDHFGLIYSEGSSADLARYLRKLVERPGFSLQDFEVRILHDFGPKGLKIPADSDARRVADWNQTLQRSGFGCIQFEVAEGKNSQEPKLSKAYGVWMWSRKLVIPTAVFAAAYAMGIHELPALHQNLGLMPPPSDADLMTPVISAGVAATVLSLIFELPRRWWNEEVFSGRLGPIFQGAAFVIAPMIIRAAEIIAILRPGEWSRDHLPLSTAFWIPTFVSTIATTITLGYSHHRLSYFEKRREISKTSHLILDTFITLFSEVGRVIYLTAQNPVVGLSIWGGVFALGSVPLGVRDLVGRRYYEKYTLYKALRPEDPKRPKMSVVKRSCVKVLGEIAMAISPSSRAIRVLWAE